MLFCTILENYFLHSDDDDEDGKQDDSRIARNQQQA